MHKENESQRRCIRYGQGPLLIVAAPGSGKTYTLTRRIQYLIEELGVPPREILVVTFSRAAAEEMQERFEKIHRQDENVTFGTFHSVFFSILKTAYGEAAERYILQGNRAAFRAQEKTTLTSPQSDRTAFRDKEKTTVPLPQFDEMLLMTRQLFYQRPDILTAVRRRYRWILADEFQDIDALQYEILRMIAGENGNLTVVGDDDQSIYGFRGARPDLMLHFEKDFPAAVRVTLDTNYRSVQEIVTAGARLIAHNQNRFFKQVRAAKGRGARIRIRKFRDAREEYRCIAAEIQDYLCSGGRCSDVAVLFRTNVERESIAGLFRELHISPVYLTFHRSKGLEFKRVYMIDCNQGVTPHFRNPDIEEERRAFYVAMTRAMEQLTICYVEKRRGLRAEPSQFVKELCE